MTARPPRYWSGRLHQDPGADAVHLRFVKTLLDALCFGERVVQAPEPGISLAGTRFGFGQGASKLGEK
jgi:hypothetical protein